MILQITLVEKELHINKNVIVKIDIMELEVVYLI